jgi:EAL domain-containing protein (putative c-di-GMP-specific phosphodiesterase class I)/CheY-like chemotaxis protein
VTTNRSPRDTKQRVLLVEAEIEASIHLAEVLERSACDVVVVARGDRAIEAVLRGKFDLVIAHANVPGIGGIDLLSMIRTFDLNVPVVLMTNLPTIESATQAVNLGAIGYLTRPFANEELVAACERAAHQRAASSEARTKGRMRADDRQTIDTLDLALNRALEATWIAFQPIVGHRGIVAYEALMQSSEPILPNPLAILEAAERLDRTEDVGRRVRRLVASAMERAPSEALIFMNAHPLDLLDTTLFSTDSPLSRHAARVVLEVTERSNLGRVDQLTTRVRMLRELGFRVALDDLGAGYGGLASFADLGVDYAKLDMSLVRGIHLSPVKRKLVAAMTDLAKELQVQIIAEGVETKEETHCVTELGCELLQGNYIARPSQGFGPIASWNSPE